MERKEQRLLALLLAACVSVSMAACGETDDDDDELKPKKSLGTTLSSADEPDISGTGEAASAVTEAPETAAPEETTTISETTAATTTPAETTTTAPAEPTMRVGDIEYGSDICDYIPRIVEFGDLEVSGQTIMKELMDVGLTSGKDLSDVTLEGGYWTFQGSTLKSVEHNIAVEVESMNPTDETACVIDLPFKYLDISELSEKARKEERDEWYKLPGDIKFGDSVETVYNALGTPYSGYDEYIHKLEYRFIDDTTDEATFEFDDDCRLVGIRIKFN